MLKRKLSNVVLTALLLGAGAVQAASVFPSPANEVSGAFYADSIQAATIHANVGAMQPVFPSAAKEHGPAREYVDVRPARGSPSIACAAAVFPTSAKEHGSYL